MFQIALPGKVRCPIRMWLLPWKHRFLCTKGEWMLRDWPPLGRFLSLQGLVLIWKTLFLLLLNHRESLE